MFSVKCGLIAITRGDTGLITVEPKDGYTPTPKDRAIFTVAQMPGAKTVISKVVTPDENGVARIPLMSADTDDLPRERQCEYTWSLRYALDAVMTGDVVTGWREMITPIPSGQFVILEANDFPSGVSCPEDERLPVKIESLKGERGEQGERGERGEKGEKGDRGEKGERGERGIQGAQGEKGDALRFDDLTLEQKAQLKGERGERGEKGEQGERGERGVQGIQGATGAQGRQGDTGLRGAKGDPFTYADFTPEQLAALKGEPGRDGAPGEPGKDAPQEAVLYTAQTLDDAQKAQARENIGAADAAQQNVLVGSETGNPIAVDDAFSAPLRGLTVYGKSTQDGTPTPDAPVPIVSAGDGGTILVTVGDGADGQQTITLQTPTGLPGIPVKSGSNYTDPQGQQWTCDEMDLERGVKVQRVNRLKLKDLSWRYELTSTNKSDTFISDVSASQAGTMQGYSLCQYAVFDGVAYDIEMNEVCRCYVWIKSVTLQFKAGLGVNSVNAFSEWLKARPDASISYCLATPIETPLTPAEIAAYKTLTAYAPDTVVQASDGAGLKLGYQRDVNIAIKKLEDAIASMTAT